MSRPITVDLDELARYQAFRRRLNRADLTSVRWVRGTKRVMVPPQAIDEWRFTGLSNLDFGLALLDRRKTHA